MIRQAGARPRRKFEDIGPKPTTIFSYSGLKPPFTQPQLERFAEREHGWEFDSQPRLAKHRGYIRPAVWFQILPAPNIHYKEIIKRFPFLEKIHGLLEYMMANCRGQNNLTVGNESTRCFLCGSHVLGLAMEDHVHENCIFKLEPMERMQFMAINHWSYCNKCNARSSFHAAEDCMKVGCNTCGTNGHTSAQGLCNLPIGEANEMAQREQKDTALNFRKESLVHIRTLLDDPKHPLKYRLYVDQRAIYVEARQRPNQAGWGAYSDSANQFPQRSIRCYAYAHDKGRNAAFRACEPPEYAVSTTHKIPVFPEHEEQYLEKCAIWITAYRQGIPMKVPEMPDDPNAARANTSRSSEGSGNLSVPPMPAFPVSVPNPAPPPRILHGVSRVVAQSHRHSRNGNMIDYVNGWMQNPHRWMQEIIKDERLEQAQRVRVSGEIRKLQRRTQREPEPAPRPIDREEQEPRNDEEVARQVWSECTRLCEKPVIWLQTTVRLSFQHAAFDMLSMAPFPDDQRSMKRRAQATLLILTGQKDYTPGAYKGVSDANMAGFIVALQAYGQRLSSENWVMCKLETADVENLKLPLPENGNGSKFIFIPTIKLWLNPEVQTVMETVMDLYAPEQASKSFDNVGDIKDKAWFNIELPAYSPAVQHYSVELNTEQQHKTMLTKPHEVHFRNGTRVHLMNNLDIYLRLSTPTTLPALRVRNSWTIQMLTGSPPEESLTTGLYSEHLEYSGFLIAVVNWLKEVRFNDHSVNIRCHSRFEVLTTSSGTAHSLYIPTFGTFTSTHAGKIYNWYNVVLESMYEEIISDGTEVCGCLMPE